MKRALSRHLTLAELFQNLLADTHLSPPIYCLHAAAEKQEAGLVTLLLGNHSWLPFVCTQFKVLSLAFTAPHSVLPLSPASMTLHTLAVSHGLVTVPQFPLDFHT